MMFDFMTISERTAKRRNEYGVLETVTEVLHEFHFVESKDIMIRAGTFYAIWNEDKKLWVTSEFEAVIMLDRELDIYVAEHEFRNPVRVLYLRNTSNRQIREFHRFCEEDMPDNYHALDDTLIFSNMETTRESYASKKLSYPLEECDISSYEKLVTTLYEPPELRKLEWCIGAIVSGDSKMLQKFAVLYGAAGTGKSTVLNIIQSLFKGYYSSFSAKALGQSANAFALEAFRTNPLVAIEHDGDLSHIEDNTRLNSLVSHEELLVNVKNKSQYTDQFHSFIFMGTNKPVRITDAKSGILRRLIDISPSGERVSRKEYKHLMSNIEFELGGIAMHCLRVYEEDPGYYDEYIPVRMLSATNDFYNFVQDSYMAFSKGEGVALKAAYELYKSYCDDAKVAYPLPRRAFQEELKNYFEDYKERYILDDGTRIRSYYVGFKADKFDPIIQPAEPEPTEWLIFKKQPSLFDELAKDWPAQYAGRKGGPEKAWADSTTKLSDISTSKLHYVNVPPEEFHHIVIDLDIPDDEGNKCYERNLEAANKFPPTYAELSKSGAGIHLHYIYTGDPAELSDIYAPHVEIKTFPGGAAIRRKLSKCNDIPVATISSGLPKKEVKVVAIDEVSTWPREKLRNYILAACQKRYSPFTVENVSLIKDKLQKMYESGVPYDVSELYTVVHTFAGNSTNSQDRCMKMLSEMHFKSASDTVPIESDNENIVFFDVEVFPNLFVICWMEDAGDEVYYLANPVPEKILFLLKLFLAGFNNLRYDNYILYAKAFEKYTERELYALSKRLVSKGFKPHDLGWSGAKDISGTDIYDFASEKKSLKKWEIEMGVPHKECDIPWDQDVPEELWPKVIEYCKNDVRATKALFHYLAGDWKTRQMLAKLSDLTVNDTTNTHSTKIIFGKERYPQKEFNYRFLNGGHSLADPELQPGMTYSYPLGTEDRFTVFADGKPIFPGYTYSYSSEKKKFVSVYRGREIGEGGNVYAEPGIYYNVALLDIASMHPSSIIAENLFGKYTKIFSEIVEARIAIKHRDFVKAKSLLEGRLTPFLVDEAGADDLAQALKIVINSVYGLTAAKFDNAFRDRRNVDNIVAKRGALFMENLRYEVQERGFTVAHIKTDSIKIPNATPEIIQFVMDYGKLYGYSFEHEATYDRMCLVNDAVYIAKYDAQGIRNKGGRHANEWTATGTQFQVPYVFKTLFSHEALGFKDYCETKEVKTALYLDFNEGLEDDTLLTKELKKCDISDPRFAELKAAIAKCHDYQFIGRVGLFCPVKDGVGGAKLMRAVDAVSGNDISFANATGCKDWRWLEADTVRSSHLEDAIDIRYFTKLANDAKAAINQFGSFDAFVA